MHTIVSPERSISEAELRNKFGNGVATSIVKTARRLRADRIPDFDQLRVGDVVLSRSIKSKPPVIERHQLEVGKPPEAAKWCHAMLYLGRLHVAESQTFHKVHNKGWQSGVRIAPLIGNKSSELMVCRIRDEFDDEEFRKEAANYALMDHAIHRRRYSYERIAAMALGSWKLTGWLAPRFYGNLAKTIICSEYVLECLAIGGTFFIEDHDAIGGKNVFYPADFAAHAGFDTFKLDSIKLRSGK